MERSISLQRTMAVDYDAAVHALTDGLADLVCDDPAAGTLDLHADVAGFDLARPVQVRFGELRELDRHAVAVSIDWEAVEHPRRFPTFDGFIELSAMSSSPPQSQLALVGRVRPPLGVLGTVGEAAGGTAIGDTVLEAVVERVADRLTGAVADNAATAAAAVGPRHMSRPTFAAQD